MEKQLISKKDIEQIKNDLQIIKNMLLIKDPEGDLSEWAIKELEKAKKVPESECLSHEEVKRLILKHEF